MVVGYFEIFFMAPIGIEDSQYAASKFLNFRFERFGFMSIEDLMFRTVVAKNLPSLVIFS